MSFSSSSALSALSGVSPASSSTPSPPNGSSRGEEARGLRGPAGFIPPLWLPPPQSFRSGAGARSARCNSLIPRCNSLFPGGWLHLAGETQPLSSWWGPGPEQAVPEADRPCSPRIEPMAQIPVFSSLGLVALPSRCRGEGGGEGATTGLKSDVMSGLECLAAVACRQLPQEEKAAAGLGAGQP